MSSPQATSGDAARHHPIAITGMHRSGTSMITRALHESGLQLVGGTADALLDAAHDNPEGFWENQAIVECNDELLEATGGAWDRPPDLPPLAVDDARVAGVVDAARTALDGLRENPPWGFKDPRLCLTAPFWLDLEPELRFVICVRHPLEVALSLKERNQNSYSLGLALWERYYATLLDDVPEDRRIVTHYNSFFHDAEAELGRLCEFAGLTAVPPSVRSDLRHFEIGVSLHEADTSDSLRRLYGRLCEESGVPAPAASPAGEDEGRVRRLILDGHVAARHAAQRQEAIENLEARLAEADAAGHELRLEVGRLKRETADARRETADARRETADARREIARLETIEQRLVELTRATYQLADTTSRVAATTTATNERLDSVEAVNRQTLRRVREMQASAGFFTRLRRARLASRKRAAQITRQAQPIARRGARHLPEPARHHLKRVKRAADDGVAGQRAGEAIGRAVERLPSPARTAALTTVQKGRAVGRRMPQPIKRLGRRAVPRDGRTSGQHSRAVTMPSRTSRDAAPVRGGRPLNEWREGYQRLVAAHVAAGSRWAVATPGIRDDALHAIAGEATRFPVASGGPPLVDQLSHVAVLETLRYDGHRHLVVPEGSRRWFQDQPELRGVLTRNARTVADVDRAGVVFELGAPAEADGRSVLAAVNSVVGDVDVAPSVLDWTSHDLVAELPGYTCFSPPFGDGGPGDGLPYFDDSIEIVVVDRQHDADEAERVASLAVICLAPDGTPVISRRDPDEGSSTAAPPVVVVVPGGGDTRWLEALGDRATQEGAELRVLADRDDRRVTAGSVVVAIEPGVIPLPGAIGAAINTVTASPSVAVAGKVLDREGYLESAGGFVFADGTVGAIGGGSDDVRAPWHEFVRDVCWAPGLVAASADLWNTNPPRALGAAGILDWCGQVWAANDGVRYQPRFAAVRVAASSLPSGVDGSWGNDRRPTRPAVMNDGAWRYLIAHDDLRAGAR